VVHAYVLMRNHFRLLVETPDGNLVAGMNELGITEKNLNELAKGAPEKGLLAWLVLRKTMIGQRWLSARLKMGAASNIGRYAKLAGEGGDPALATRRKRLLKAIHDK
jgi:putative transposase